MINYGETIPDYDFEHWDKFNSCNQGKSVKILRNYNSKPGLKGKIGIYTGVADYSEGFVFVRIGTRYYEIYCQHLEFVPMGALTETLYGS